jgi:hypothetical protein
MLGPEDLPSTLAGISFLIGDNDVQSSSVPHLTKHQICSIEFHKHRSPWQLPDIILQLARVIMPL